ncbi:TlpA disulfide reductase family protein [Methylomarinum vadi]|uniref:TlpA disulfide reductase family protein n=1 Tax=Methylomarinum vadi TaxID=438855 RepID=UPI0004DFACF3|nr:TlpA disulfide reductase family protein [Methylomarinum vadi]
MKHKLILVAGLLTVLSLVGWLLTDPTPHPAPNVSFKTISNKDISLRNLRGRPVIITFWATDCPACIEEIPHLLELYRLFHPHGLEMIAVAMYYDLPSHVVEMSKIKQLPYDIALDLRAELSKAFGGVMLTPTTFLISPGGDIVLKKLGGFELNAMKHNIEAMLSRSKNAQSM